MRPGQERNVDAEAHEQEEQNRHHDLVGLLNAAGDTHRHDGERGNDCNDNPRQVADRNDVEVAARWPPYPGPWRAYRPGDGDRSVLEDPAHDDGIADGQRHGSREPG